MSTKQKKIVWPALAALIACGAFTFVVTKTRATLNRRQTLAPANVSPGYKTPGRDLAISSEPANLSVPQALTARLEAELITITPGGFEPGEITRPAGRFLLAIDNRSGLEDISLSLVRAAGSKLREQRVSRSKASWREVVDLTPGTFALTEANHPGWICRITISTP